MRILTLALVSFLALVCAMRTPGRSSSDADTSPATQALLPKGGSGGEDGGTKDDDDEDYRTVGAWAAVRSGSGETTTHRPALSSVDPSGTGS